MRELRRRPALAFPPVPGVASRRVAALACLALILCGALVGCGNSRTKPVDLTQPLVPQGFRQVSYAAAGLRISVPRDWSLNAGTAPLVATISSGEAIVALWRFPRPAPMPASAMELRQARRQLIRVSRRRDPSLRIIRSGTGSVEGHPALEIDTLQRIAGQLRRVRSLHIFLAGHEVVLEQYAPPASFHRVDHLVFSPIKRSLRILSG